MALVAVSEKMTRSESKELIRHYEEALSKITVRDLSDVNIRKAIENAEIHIPSNKLKAVFSSLEKRDKKFIYWKYDYISRDYVNLYVTTAENGQIKYAVQIFNQENVRNLYNVLDWFDVTKEQLPKEPDEALIILLKMYFDKAGEILNSFKREIKTLEEERENMRGKMKKLQSENVVLDQNNKKIQEQAKFHDGVLWTPDFNFMECTTNEAFVDGYNNDGERSYIITSEDGSTAILYYKKDNNGHIQSILACKLSNGNTLTMNTAINCSYDDIMIILQKLFLNKIVRVSMQTENDRIFKRNI